MMLTVTKRAARVGGNSPTGAALLARVGKLYLVDLAGSERLKKSMSTGAADAMRMLQPPDVTDEMVGIGVAGQCPNITRPLLCHAAQSR